jgi:hypothetical protein
VKRVGRPEEVAQTVIYLMSNYTAPLGTET